MKKILFSCAGCNTSYSISRHDAETLPSGVFICKTCGKKIKLAFCPRCGTSYSIGFSRQLQGSYPLKCRRCGREFRISFESTIAQKSHKVMPLEGGHAERKKKIIDSISDNHAPQEESRKTIPEKKVSRQNLTEDFFSFEAAKCYGISIFKIKKIVIAAVGILALSVMLMASSWADNFFQRLEFVRQNHFIRHLLNFIEIFITSTVILSVNTVIARMDAEKNKGTSKNHYKDVPLWEQYIGKNHFLLILFLRMKAVVRGAHNEFFTGTGLISFAVSRALTLMAGVAGIILAFNALIVLFSSIPVIGPILYSLLFLPVYALSISIVLLSLIAFWFYPPLLAYAGDVRSSIAEFLNFVRKHHVTLLLVGLVLLVVTTVFAGLLLLFHNATLAVVISLSGAFLGDEFSKIIPPVSASIGEGLNFIAFFSRLSLMHHIMGELLTAHRIGGIFFGAVIVLISTAIYSIILSAAGTLSVWAYRAVESGRYPDVRQIRFFLFTLFLILAILYLFKKMFVS